MVGTARKFALGLVLALGGVAAAGETPAAYAEGFEEQVPGTAPKGWRKAWGNQADDRIVVTNEKAAAGDNALLVEHFAANEGQWGLAAQLPSPGGDWASVSFTFQVDGSGGGFSAEIRDKNGKDRLTSFGVGKSKVEAWVDGKKKGFGKVENGNWYTVNLKFPLTEAAGKYTKAELIAVATGESVQFDLNAAAPTTGFGNLTINLPPKAPDFRLYLDDISVR